MDPKPLQSAILNHLHSAAQRSDEPRDEEKQQNEEEAKERFGAEGRIMIGKNRYWYNREENRVYECLGPTHKIGKYLGKLDKSTKPPRIVASLDEDPK